MAFSAASSALEGFRVVGRRPVSFVVWTLLASALVLAALAGLAWLFGDLDLPTADRLEPAQALELVGKFGGASLVAVAVMIPVSLVLYNAMLRSVLRPEDRTFAYLRIGGDEWRMFLLWLLFLLVTLAFYAAVVALAVGVQFLDLPQAGKVGLWVLLGLVAVMILIFVGLRWSLAGPVVLAERRVSLSRSWKLTRGRFWPILGMALLAWILGSAISWIAQLVIQLATSPLMAGWTPDPEKPFENWEQIAEQVQGQLPAAGLLLLVYALAIMLQQAVMVAPFAAAYRDIAAPDAPSHFD